MLERIAEGRSVSAAAEELDVKLKHWWKWLASDPARLRKYAEARVIGVEALADQLVSIADGALDNVPQHPGLRMAAVAHAKLKIDTRKWILEALAPETYGKRVKHNHGGSVSVVVETGVPDRKPPVLSVENAKDAQATVIEPPKQVTANLPAEKIAAAADDLAFALWNPAPVLEKQLDSLSDSAKGMLE